jgi:hypothetical protein
VLAFDQVVKKICGQGDADNRPENKMRPPLYFAQYDHWRERTIGDSESQQVQRRPTKV